MPEARRDSFKTEAAAIFGVDTAGDGCLPGATRLSKEGARLNSRQSGTKTTRSLCDILMSGMAGPLPRGSTSSIEASAVPWGASARDVDR